MASCSQCTRPAVFQQETTGYLLCLEHWALLQRIVNENNTRLLQEMMYMENKMMDTLGLPRKYQMVTPQNHTHNNSYTDRSVNVSGSTIGLLNTAAVERLNANINLVQQQNPELAKATDELLSAVFSSDKIEDEEKKKITQQVEFLVSEAAKGENQRNVAVAGLTLQALSTLLQSYEFLSTYWTSFSTIIKQVLGL